MSNGNVLNEVTTKSNIKSVVSLILGILSIVTSFTYIGFILGIMGLVYGFIGLKEINRFKQNGKRKIIAGIVCCLIGIFFTIFFSVVASKILFN